jgi:hypothetical protein
MAFCWAVEPLAFRVGLPPQLTFADDVPVVALPELALWSPPHADNTTAPAVGMLSAAPNRLSLKGIVVARVAAARQTAAFLAAMRHSNKITLRPRGPRPSYGRAPEKTSQ